MACPTMTEMTLGTPATITTDKTQFVYWYWKNKTVDPVAVIADALGNTWTWSASPSGNNPPGVNIQCEVTDFSCNVLSLQEQWYDADKGNPVSFTVNKNEQVLFTFSPDDIGQSGLALIQLQGGGGGDPHFLGLDGRQFDYAGDPNTRYLIWDGNGMRVEAFFEVPKGTKRTIITRMDITVDGTRRTLVPEDFLGVWEEVYLAEQELGLERGLPTPLQTIRGDVVGSKIISFANGKMSVTCISSFKGFWFLNFGFRLYNVELSRGADGIIGQTLRPAELRRPNDDFKVVNVKSKKT